MQGKLKAEVDFKSVPTSVTSKELNPSQNQNNPG